MWHTHMLASLEQYTIDCLALSGKTLDHDDSLNDRSEDSDLERGFKATCALWQQHYGEEYPVPGGMFRGEPPRDFHRV